MPVPAGRKAEGSLTPPASKSVTQRYLLAAVLAEGSTVIEGPLRSADTAATVAALPALGGRVDESADGSILRVESVVPPMASRIECGANGTLLRLAMGVAAALPGRRVLDGTPRLRERPVAPLGGALERLGAGVRYLGRAGFAPVEIDGGHLVGGAVAIDAGLSSQYVSALLLAAVGGREEVEISASSLVSAPYVELTLRCLADLGARIERPGGAWRVIPRRLRGCRVRVEPDASAACYPAAAAALTGGRVLLRHLSASGAQGDLALFGLLARMGAAVHWGVEGVTVEGRGLEGIEADLSALPDQVPTLAALAPFARGTTVIRGVPHLRLKESDRLAVMARELTRLGAVVHERSEGLEIPGLWAESAPPTDAVTVDPAGDHRVAMSLALTGLRRSGVRVGDWQVVAKSYPGFWLDLEALVERAA
jgi:3-phosphoshikimate 1-carboxyvinyltransferase